MLLAFWVVNLCWVMFVDQELWALGTEEGIVLEPCGMTRLGSHCSREAGSQLGPSCVSIAGGLGLFVPGNLARVAASLCAIPAWPQASWQGT